MIYFVKIKNLLLVLESSNEVNGSFEKVPYSIIKIGQELYHNIIII